MISDVYEKKPSQTVYPAHIVKLVGIVSGSKELYAMAEKGEDVKMCRALDEIKEEGRQKGLSEGVAKGKALGRTEGLAEGKAQGRTEGLAEGKALGRTEGLAEGKKQGRTEGKLEGISFAKQVFVLHMNGKTGEQIASELKVPVPEVNELLAGISNC